MLGYGELDLADLVIHELMHATVWVAGDVAFNESLATFVGEAGSMLWLKTKYGEASPEVARARALREDRRRFGAFMHELALELERVYASGSEFQEKLNRREEVYRAAQRRFEAVPMATGAYASFPRWKLNNARLAAYRVYHDTPQVFLYVLAAVDGDVRDAVEVFRGCEAADDPEAYLEEWVGRRE